MPEPVDQRISVAVVFGGQSTEHEVSCLTAAGVLGAIDDSRYVVHGIGIDKSGVWHRYQPEEILGLKVVDDELPSVDPHRPEAILVRGAEGVRLASVEGQHLVDEVPIDVAFPVMHGAYSEDGTVQGHFEMLGLRYVGCGVTSSAVGMDKQFMRVCFEQAGVPVGPWLAIGAHEWPSQSARLLARIRDELVFPVYVKPARGGSSVGISRVDDPSGLAAAIEEAHRWDPKVIVENGVLGAREVELAVLGTNGGRPRVSIAGEIVMHTDDAFYDYEAKYTPDDATVTLAIPADVDPATLARLQEVAAATFEAMECEGLARVDTFVTADGQVWVNELNTMPGFTRTSMYPSLWAASGIGYADLIAELIQLALDRPLGLR